MTLEVFMAFCSVFFFTNIGKILFLLAAFPLATNDLLTLALSRALNVHKIKLYSVERGQISWIIYFKWSLCISKKTTERSARSFVLENIGLMSFGVLCELLAAEEDEHRRASQTSSRCSICLENSNTLNAHFRQNRVLHLIDIYFFVYLRH